MKQSILLILSGMVLILALSETVLARVDLVTEEWVATYDGTANEGDDRAEAIAVDHEGNVIITGDAYMTGGNRDYVTIKYDPDGNPLWTATYDGPDMNSDESVDVAVDSTGNIYVTGSSEGDTTNRDCTTVKYDPNGNEVWVARFSTPGDAGDYGAFVSVDPWDNVYVCGYSYGFGTGGDYITIKYDPDGNELWMARYNGTDDSSDNLNGMHIDAQGNVYVTGQSTDIGPQWLITTIKYDTEGNQLWVAKYDGPASDYNYCRSVTVDDQGNVYVTGYVSYVDAEEDCVTIKYDADGNQLWAALYNRPGDEYDSGVDLMPDTQGNVVVLVNSGSSGTADIMTLKYDSSGNLLWVARYDGLGNNFDYEIKLMLDSEENIYVAGATNSVTTGDDMIILKYDSNGNLLWVAQYDGPIQSGERSHDFVVDEEDNIYLTGYTTVNVNPVNRNFCAIKYIQVDSAFGTKCTAKAGKRANTDSLKFYGDFLATPAELTTANQIDLTIWSDSGFEYNEPPIPFSADEIKKGIYKYKRKVPRGQVGGVTAFQFDTKKQRFTLTASKMSLQGLNSPMGVDVIIGDYLEVSVADESIINNKKPIPMTLMRNYSDALRVDKAKVKAGRNPDTDSLQIQGGLAADNTLTNPCAENLVISWADQTFTVAKEDITVKGDNLYNFKNVIAIEGGTVTGSIDLVKCTFRINIEKATITTQAGSVELGLTFEGFNQSYIYDL